MSCDKRSMCPNCSKQARKELELARSEYGRVPFEEFKKKLSIVEEKLENCENSFREYYQFHISGDVLNIDYRGTCDVCGFSFSLNKRFNMILNKEII